MPNNYYAGIIRQGLVRHFTPFFEIAFFPGLSSVIDGGGYHKVTQKILLKSTVIPLRYEGLKIGSCIRRNQYNLWHQHGNSISEVSSVDIVTKQSVFFKHTSLTYTNNHVWIETIQIKVQNSQEYSNCDRNHYSNSIATHSNAIVTHSNSFSLL